MKTRPIRKSWRSRLENRSMSHKVLITTLILAATAVSLAAGAGGGGAASTKANATPGLGESLSQLVAAGAPGATLLVRRGDRTTLLARGFAETATKKRMRPGDSFRIGSLTKTYVATVLLQLVEEGRLSLDDPVTRFLPGLVPGGDKITIRQLLNQTSGLFDYEKDPRVLAPYLAGNLAYRWAPRKLVRIAVSHRPLFKPGSALVVLEHQLHPRGADRRGGHRSDARASTRPALVQAAASAPHRVSDLAPDGGARCARLLRVRQAARHRHHGIEPSYPWAAGALVANAADVASFYRALLSGRLLNAGSLRALKTTVTQGKGAEMGARYGLGIERFVTPCGIAWGHGGSMPGYDVYALSSTNGRRQVVLSINLDPSAMPQAPSADVRPATVRRLLQSIALPRIDEGVGPSGAASRHPSSSRAAQGPKLRS